MPTKILIEDVLFIGTVEAKYLNLDEVERELSRGFRNRKISWNLLITTNVK